MLALGILPLLDVLVFMLAMVAVPRLREGVRINMLVADMDQVGLAYGTYWDLVYVAHELPPLHIHRRLINER